jgi:hypothetical protein
MSQERKLANMLDEMSARARHTIDVEYLVAGWERLVSETSVGYPGNIYEYTNDLSKRDLLEEIVTGAPGSLGEIVRQRIEKADENYRDATLAISHLLLPRIGRHDRWWWYRVPRVLKDELKSDLEGAGFLAEGVADGLSPRRNCDPM